MQLESFASSIIQEDDMELFTFLGDGGNLPPLSRTYAEISALTRDLQANISRLDLLEGEIERSIQNINTSLAANEHLPSPQIRSDLQSPPSAPPSQAGRIRRVPSMDNLAAIDCERIAVSLAASFPQDESISPGWSFNPKDREEPQMPYRSASCQIR